MNLILFLIIFPIAIIIYSITLQKTLKSPILAAATIFATFLIVTYIGYGINYLIISVIYGILSLIVAYATEAADRIFNEDEQNSVENQNANNERCCMRRYNNFLRRR